MKILQVSRFYHPFVGGIENHLHLLCNQLRQSVDVEVLTANTKPRTISEDIDGVKVVRAGRWLHKWSTPFCPSFPSLLQSAHADIIHIHMPHPMGELSYLLSDPPGKLVVTYHMDAVKPELGLKFYKPLLLKFLDRVDQIIATSPNYIESSPILQRFHSKCIPIPYGIDLDIFSNTPAVQIQGSHIRQKYGDRIVLFVGRLIYYKGVEYAIRAMKDVEGKLLVIGNGELEHTLKQLAAELGLSDKVIFLGEIPNTEIQPYYYAADVFVLPSIYRTEAFGIVQLEAQLCGLPVVCTSLDTGVPYVNQHDITGLVVPPRDHLALATAINTLLGQPEVRQRYGKNGRDRVINTFTKELMVERILNLYHAVLDS